MKHVRPALYALLLGAILTLLAGCNGGSEQPGPSTPVTSPAQAGQRWGGFLFCDEPASCVLPPDQITPPPRPLKGDEGDLLIAGHPGYREFKTIDDLARFINGRAVLRVPQFLPPDAELLGGYAVVGDEGRIFTVGISYRLGDSDAPINDADVWINYDLYTPRPSAFGTSERQVGLGRSIAAPRLLTVRGQETIFQEARNPPGLARDQIIRSSLNWFEEDDSFWAVQARGLDLATLVAIAESLRDY